MKLKRILSLLLALTIGLSFSACGKNESTIKDNGTNSSGSDYVGIWSEDNISWEMGGLIIEISLKNNETQIYCGLTQSAPASRVAEFTENINLSDIENNTLNLAFSNDGWGNSGKLELTFNKEYILADFKDVVLDDFAEWGFYENTYKLVRKDNAYDLLKYDIEDYYELYPKEDVSVPTYDTSKASGILAQAGLTEEEFKNLCEPLGFQESFSAGDVPTHYELSFGKNFYYQYPDDAVFEKAKSDYQRMKETTIDAWIKWGYPYETFEGYLSRNIYAKKGHELIDDNTRILFERMCEYPSEYLGKAYAIHSRQSPKNYIGSYDWFNGTQITIKDLRDNTSAPNIINDKDYIFYVIFNGTFSAYGGEIVLSFSLLSLDKIS